MTEEITYDLSMQVTKTVLARHHCTPDWVRVYLPMLVHYSAKVASTELSDLKMDASVHYDEALFKVFTIDVVYYILLERICLECRINNRVRVERGLGKVLIRGRCKPYAGFPCKIHSIADEVFKEIEFDL